MKTKLLPTIFIFVFLIAIFFTTLSAIAADTVQETSCFSFYNFTGNYFSSVWVDKYKYSAGDKLIGGVILKDINNYPMPDLNVRAYVFYVGDTFKDRLEGNDLVDEMWIAKDINLLPGQTKNIDFTWQSLQESKSGFYLISFYLLSSNQFNFGGLSFFPEIAGKSTFFEMVNTNINGLLFFDKNNVTVNENPYKFRSNVGDFVFPITVKAKLTNLGPGVKIDVTYILYTWDDSSESNKIDEKKESFFIEKSKSHDVVYSLPGNLDNQVYQISITAVAEDGRKSIIKIRLPTDTQKGRFIFLGLDKFPIQANELNEILWCFSNSAFSSYKGKQTIEVQDRSEKILKSYEFDPVMMSGNVNGASQSFSSGRSLYYVKLIGKIYDEKNNLQQKVEVVYDASKFGLEVPSPDYSLIFIAIIIIVAIVLIWYWRRR